MGNRDIIAIGGSAGAPRPLQEILRRLPDNLKASVFIVLHIPSQGIATSQGNGIFSSFAAAACRLPVREAEDGMPIEQSTVYLAAHDRHMLIDGGRIILGHGPRENLARPAIDPLFRSAVIHYGPRVIGVVLSGFLSDGAAGLCAIKRCGGIALVQDPNDAVADEMPLSALEAAKVDFCVPSARLGDVLADLTRESAGAPLPIPPALRWEVAIAAGDRIETQRWKQISDRGALTCPRCGDVLSEINGAGPLRFRCQVGHAFAADILANLQEGRVDEALGVALRIVEERAKLVERMAKDGRASGRRAVAEMYEARTKEYREYADLIRHAALRTLGTREPPRRRLQSPPRQAEDT